MSNTEKVWFITGSNSGFGRSLTEAVLAKGEKVVATTRHPEQVQDLAKEIAPLGIKLTLVEPGAFRTDFAGGSLATPENPIDDYQETAHKFVEMQEQMSGEQPGDPDKAAQAMIKAVESDNPPMRLVLGEDALKATRQKIETFQQELADWEDVTLSTSFEDAQTTSLG